MPSIALSFGPLLVVAGFAAAVGLSQALHHLKYGSIPHEYLDAHITSREPDMGRFGTFCLITLFAIATGYFGSSRPLVFESSGMETLNSLLLVGVTVVYALLATQLILSCWKDIKEIDVRYEARKLHRAEKAARARAEAQQMQEEAAERARQEAARARAEAQQMQEEAAERARQEAAAAQDSTAEAPEAAAEPRQAEVLPFVGEQQELRRA